MVDPIPNEDFYQFEFDDEGGLAKAVFVAFNTVVQLQAYGCKDVVAAAFDEARAECRRYERLFSRTLPHSDIALLNAARGAEVPISQDTHDLMQAALRYCEASGGVFDVTIGPAVALWDFKNGVVADAAALAEAVRHVDYRNVRMREQDGSWVAWLEDADAQVDFGGIAKGYIADALGELLVSFGVEAFIVDLGGNVLVHGQKPDGSEWRVGIRNPKDTSTLLGALPLTEGSVVTSGIYERGFDLDGRRFHHILNAKTGYPVETDVAGVSVVARRSIDAEGYSTTLLALGLERGMEFARSHPAIETAIFVDNDNNLYQV